MTRQLLGTAVLLSLMAAPPLAAEEPKHGGVITWAVKGAPKNYDCHGTTSYTEMYYVAPHYSLLVKLNPEDANTVTSDLAESWEISDDKLVYTFKLHDSVKFHDGSPFGARDVKATFDRIRMPPEGVVSLRASQFADIEAIETPDDLTVVFRLSQPNPSFLTRIAAPFNCIYSAERLAEDPLYPLTSVLGTGPFVFDEYVPGSHWVGKRNENYFVEGLPYLDGFRAVEIAKSSAVVAAMESGSIHGEFRGFTPPERDTLVQALGDKVQVLEANWANTVNLTFNVNHPPFDDVRVRRALNMAVDRWGGGEVMRRLTMLRAVGGTQRPSSEIAANDSELKQWPGYAEDMEAAREEARRLLAEAGHSDLKFTLLTRDQEHPYRPLSIYLIDQWRKIGVEVENGPSPNWITSLKEGTFDVAVDYTVNTIDDPSAYLEKYLSADISSLNFANHIDRKLDELYEQQATESDPAKRAALIRDFEAHLFEQSYSVPLFWWNRILVLDSRVKGYEIMYSHMLNMDIADVWLED